MKNVGFLALKPVFLSPFYPLRYLLLVGEEWPTIADKEKWRL
jgi:hypothetical protein